MGPQGIFPGWKVVFGSGFGIAFGSAVFVGSSFSLVAAAIAAQFGWTQADLAKGASIFLLLQMVGYPVVGLILDRFGSRRVAAASIVLFALMLAGLSQISDALWQFYLAFFLIGLLAPGTNIVSYARAITHWFDRRRGLALGVAMGLQAVGAFLMPLAIQKIIAIAGWPQAIVSLAVFELVVCLPLVVFLVRDDPRPYGLYPDGDDADHAGAFTDVGLGVRDIVRSATFWKLAIAFAIMGMTFYAVVTNLAFILTKTAGLSLAQVATVLAVAGVAILFGRIGFGYLLDRFNAQVVSLLALSLAVMNCIGYAVGQSFGFVIVAAIVGGVSVGGEGDLAPYFAGRYFGKKASSNILGWFLSAYVLGAAFGPIAFARASEVYDGASIPLFGLAALQIVPAILFLTLGPYPKPVEACA